ncbi:MAG TPA: hypothetical protein RMH99_32305 [Sandaracinaceae bacterium LLY-WYZ-13_1]|nr:hypothetical protein [Sandaracinaceae bacterium LLY-WYZ-13_1]
MTLTLSSIPRAPSRAPLVVLDVDPDLALGRVGPIGLAVWHGPHSVRNVERQHRAMRDVAVARPHDAAYLAVLRCDEPPDHAAARRMVDLARELGGRFRAVAIVLEGGSIPRPLAAAIVAGVGRLVPRGAVEERLRFFSTAADATRWLAPDATQAVWDGLAALSGPSS